MKRLSIIIPAYNEEKFVGRLLQKILTIPIEIEGFEREIIVVDDGSQDRTLQEASRFPEVKCFQQIPNQGKGRAVQRGIQESTGEFIIVQDADLEYDPHDYLPMLRVIGDQNKVCVYGSRLLGQLQQGNRFPFPGKHPRQGIGPWLAGCILSIWTFCLYGKWISDTLTAYKIYPAHVIKQFQIYTHGFETDHELTAKLIRSGIPIVEIPIHYFPRTREEGKKIQFSDGLKALWTLLRFRFSPYLAPPNDL